MSQRQDAFESELALVNAFAGRKAEFLRQMLGRSRARSFSLREFDSTIGIADLVIGTYRARELHYRAGAAPINANWVAPLKRLNKGAKFSAEIFSQNMRVSRALAKKMLSNYVESGFVTMKGTEYQVLKNYHSFPELTFSIEAKLKNWQRALMQARRYRRFSNFSFVLLDARFAGPAIHAIEYFKAAQVGLMSLSATDLKFHHIPAVAASKETDYLMRLSEVSYESVYRLNFVE